METRSQRMARLAAAAAALILSTALWSCGSQSPTAPASSEPPNGTGNGSLLVVAEVSGSEAEDIRYGGPYAGQASAVFMTAFTVSVADPLGAPVSRASVRISTPKGPVTLSEDATVPGTYRAAIGSYTQGTYVLDVVSGSDRVQGAEVVAPDIHTIIAPQSRSKVPARGPLVVRWRRATAAQEAFVESRDYASRSAQKDDGSGVIPPAGNPVRADQRIEVLRCNRAPITGGLAGSLFTAQIRNSVDSVVAE